MSGDSFVDLAQNTHTPTYIQASQQPVGNMRGRVSVGGGYRRRPDL